MLKSSHHIPPSRLTFDDGLTIRRAREAYRVQTVLYSLVLLVVGMQMLMMITLGLWLKGVLILGFQLGACWGLRWLWRQGLPRAWTWMRTGARAWWHGLLLVLLLGSGAVSGCHSLTCGALGLHGYTCDANAPVACTQESRQLGYCGGVAAGANEKRSQ
jgi:hypothetical protein